jgi:hydrogenase expression/formation protein HypD
MAAYQAKRQGLRNFSLLVAHVLVPPALEALLSSPHNRAQGFLAAGHVCTVMGFEEYEPLARTYRVPIVVTGFEPLDILQGVYLCVQQLEESRAEVENQYTRSVTRAGNRPAQQLIGEVYRVVPRPWRGLGGIPRSGLGLSARYADLDAERRFPLADVVADEPTECIAGLVLQGVKENAIPVREEVQGACAVLGLDPLYVANEGRFVSFVPAGQVGQALDVLRAYPVSAEACRIGVAQEGVDGLVTMTSRLGTSRVIDLGGGEQLPRIC